jgi:succinoglycan biosynthesis transport protein ExoP
MDSNKIASAPEARLHFLDYWRIIRIRKTVILAVFLLVVITATLVTFILPESYASTTRIRVERDATDVNPVSESRMSAGFDPYYLQTEFEVIQSELILDPVIAQLRLNDVWARKYGAAGQLKTPETRSLLQRQIDLRTVPHTFLIDIRVFSDKPDEAARIADTIAEEYTKHREEQRQSKMGGGIKQLKEEYATQAKKVTAKREEVDQLRSDLGVSEYDPNNPRSSMTPNSKTLDQLQSIRIDTETRLTSEEKQLAMLQELDREKRVQALPTALPYPDTGLNDLLSTRNLAQQGLARAREDYGPAHAEVIKLTNTLAKLDMQIDERIEGIMKGMETKVQAYRATLTNIVQEVEKAKLADIEKARKSGPYFVAKQELEDLLNYQKLLQMKIAMDETDLKLPTKGAVEIINHAKPDPNPVKPNKPLNIILGIVIGLVVGVGLAFFIEYLDTSVKTIDDVERALGCPVLGVIPQNVGLILYEGAESPHAEAYRVLRTNLLFSRKDDKFNTICLVSAGAGEGKTTTAANLATVFAQGGQRVLLVDSDLRRPNLHKVLRVSNNVGLTSYLLKQNTLEEVIQTTSLATLDFLPSGKLPSSSLGILNSPAMKSLIGELKQRYDFVFFDSPPMMGVSDASILASEMDLTLQVIQYRRYPQPMNIRAKQMIEKVGGTLIGIVLNNINMSQDESYYYYSGYYHDYYYSRNEGDASGKPEKEGEAGAGAGDKATPEIKPKY